MAIVQLNVAEARFKSNSKLVTDLPSVSDFQLDKILSEIVSPDINNLKDSVLLARDNYQRDLRHELKKYLCLEQQLQHKNIKVLRMSQAFLDKLSKLKKEAHKSKKSATKMKSGRQGREESFDLKVVQNNLSLNSKRARNLLTRLIQLNAKVTGSTQINAEITPLIYRLGRSHQDNSGKSSNVSPSDNLKASRNPLSNDTSSTDYEAGDFNQIIESNIYLYRQRIMAKQKEKEDKCQESFLEGFDDDQSQTQKVKGKPSLHNFATAKSSATVFETNLNSLHKKLRINPHPLAIYNSVMSGSALDETEVFGDVSGVSRNEKFVDSSKAGKFTSGPSETLYLKILQISEANQLQNSSGSDGSMSDEEQSRSSSSNQSAVPRGSSAASDKQNFFSFHPVQKHTPLHHTHRPSQSILKKKCIPMTKPKVLAPGSSTSQDDTTLSKLNQSKGDFPVSAVSVRGHFISTTESITPILQAMRSPDAPTDNSRGETNIEL